MSQVPASSVFSSWSKKLASQILTYAESIRTAIYRHGIVWQGGVQIFAYEVYDDSNIPSLMSLPYLGFVDSEDEIYQNTRRFLLS
jgi:meiotically up-regulated gene 157 (Mug157) protein